MSTYLELAAKWMERLDEHVRKHGTSEPLHLTHEEFTELREMETLRLEEDDVRRAAGGATAEETVQGLWKLGQLGNFGATPIIVDAVIDMRPGPGRAVMDCTCSLAQFPNPRCPSHWAVDPDNPEQLAAWKARAR